MYACEFEERVHSNDIKAVQGLITAVLLVVNRFEINQYFYTKKYQSNYLQVYANMVSNRDLRYLEADYNKYNISTTILKKQTIRHSGII